MIREKADNEQKGLPKITKLITEDKKRKNIEGKNKIYQLISKTRPGQSDRKKC